MVGRPTRSWWENSPGDTIGWITDQLAAEDAACVVINVAEDMIRTQFLGTGAPTDGGKSVDEMRWNADTTISDIIRAQDAGTVESGQLVAVC
ncbi:hypothetical protein GCM10022247_14100 [Allokutzneria multivorans]|uniref:Uncharacterized protein n=1 Tax=Allokutzneria multivorans TaxID=1142134 RepID=A0ABP7RD02_9PSEU